MSGLRVEDRIGGVSRRLFHVETFERFFFRRRSGGNEGGFSLELKKAKNATGEKEPHKNT